MSQRIVTSGTGSVALVAALGLASLAVVVSFSSPPAASPAGESRRDRLRDGSDRAKTDDSGDYRVQQERAAVEATASGRGGADTTCCTTGHGPGCDDPFIEACVCAVDPYCCDTDWDQICVDEVDGLGCGTCPTAEAEACCFPSGECTDEEPSDCFSFGGTPQGAGTDCSTTVCPVITEACCLPGGGCFDVDPSSCLIKGGSPQGDGTTCSSIICPQPAEACCLLDGSCFDVDAATCTFELGGTPQGLGTDCGSVVCDEPLEACCVPAGSCLDLTVDDCTTNGGIPQGPGTDCGSVVCGEPLQACCFTDGSCQDLLPADCTGSGGIPQGPGSGCLPVPTNCPQPPQACCFGDGSCADLDPNQCTGMGGEPQGSETDCSTVFCSFPAEACCFPDGGCLDLYSGDCVAEGGNPQGPTSSCDTSSCPQPVEACCLPDTTCVDLPVDQCLNNGGAPQGLGTDCSTITCPEPLEACCFADGSCNDLPAPSCLEAGGSAAGPGTSCGSFFCPQPLEACCFSDGSCVTTLPSECDSLGGTSEGPGSVCLGDENGNGQDDACEPPGPCGQCGPAPHFIDVPPCPEGTDDLVTAALAAIDVDLDCVADTNLILSGPVSIRRSEAMDDSIQFPGLSVVDGHLDVIDTEINSMTLSGSGVSLAAGSGGTVGLTPSLGAIVEQVTDSSLADSFFDVFFEVDLGGGSLAYNQKPLRVQSIIHCIPPIAEYVHPFQCIPLYTSPIAGEGILVANLLSARHDTFPGCGSPAAGDCFVPNGTPYCDDQECCEDVCLVDPYCCQVAWDATCVAEALEICFDEPPPPDYWTTWRDDEEPDQTYQDLTLPAGFFGDGCEAVTERIEFAGEPLDVTTTGDADTCVRRNSDPVTPDDPPDSVGTTGLQIEALSLVSVAPITVICDGLPQRWTVSAGLSPTAAPEGTLIATKTHDNGGTFQSTLYVQPLLTFTRTDVGCNLGDTDGDGDTDLDDYEFFEGCLGGPASSPGPGCDCVDFDSNGTVDLEDFAAFQLLFTGDAGGVSSIVLDTALAGMPPIEFAATDVPFVHEVNPGLDVITSAGARFVPGIRETIPGDLGSQVPEVVTEEALLARHRICVPRPKCEVDMDIHCSVDEVENDVGAFVPRNIAAVTPANFGELKFLMRPFSITAKPANGTLELFASTNGVIQVFKPDGSEVVLPATILNFVGPVTWLVNGKDFGKVSLTAKYTPPGGQPCEDKVKVRVNCFPGLASETLADFPHAEYVRNVNRGETLRTSLDPVRHAERVGMRYAVYVSPHKTAAQYNANNTLSDVTGTIEEFPVAGRTIAANFHNVWAPINTNGLFDVVFDFGNCPKDPADFVRDGKLDPGDVIGLLTMTSTNGELRVLSDPGVDGPENLTSSLYDLGTIGIPADFDTNSTTTGFAGVRLRGRFVRPNPMPAGTPLVAIAHGNHTPHTPPTATAPVIPGARDGTASAVTVSLDAVQENWTLTLQANGRWAIAGSVSGAQGESAALAAGTWTVTSANGFISLTITQGATMPFVAGDVITFTVNRPPDDPTAPNFDGYIYLQRHLATHGVASISVDLDRFSALFPGIRHRGWTLLRNIDAMLGQEANLSRTNVTLVGHSRGGEAVLQAYRILRTPGERPAGGTIANFNAAAIKGIVSISPTVFHDAQTTEPPYDGERKSGMYDDGGTERGLPVPFLLIYGGADGDVNGITRGVRPFETYDRVAAVKQVVFVEGVNHNFFNTSWACDDGRQQVFDSGPPPGCLDVSPAGMGANLVAANNVRDLAEAYVGAFVFKHALDHDGYDDFFRRFHNRFRPPSVAAALQILGQYKDTTLGTPRNFVVDDYESQPATGTASSGSAVTRTVTINPFGGVDEPLLRDPDEFFDFVQEAELAGPVGAPVGGVRLVTLRWFFSSDFDGTLPAARNGQARFQVRHTPVAMRAVPETWTLTLNAAGRWVVAGSVSGAQGMSGALAAGQWQYTAPNGRMRCTIVQGAGAGAFVATDVITFVYRGVNLDEGQSINRFMQETMGVVVSWPAAQQNYQYELPTMPVDRTDLSDDRYLSVRVAKTVPDPSMRGVSIEFTVTLEDTAGTSSSMRTSTFSTIPGGYVSGFRRVLTGSVAGGNPLVVDLDQWTTTPVFRTFRLDICPCTNLGNDIDIRDIRFYRFEFGGATGTDNGNMAIDDSEVTLQ